MVSVGDFLVQIFQPYFFYSLAFVSIALLCIKLFLTLNPEVSRRTQSLLYLVPLVIPVFVFDLFFPQPTISLMPSPPPGRPFIVPTFGAFPGSVGLGTLMNSFKLPSVVSVTGWLCIGGVIVATVYLAVTMVFGKRLAMKTFHVIMMSLDEYAPLQNRVRELAYRMGVPKPKVGLTEDLRPNAFTLGWGRGAVLVFSLGILKMLDDAELEAVVSHELAHVKAQDYLFRGVSYSLNLLSFFNPLSYFAVSQAQKERELLADQEGAAQLSQPTLMAKVLARLGGVLETYPKEGFTGRLSASLFLVSPLVRRPQILAAHPQIAHRVNNINTASFAPMPWAPRRKTVALCIMAVLIATALMSSYALVQVQTTYFHSDRIFMTQNQTIGSRAFGMDAGDADRVLSVPVGDEMPVAFGFPTEPPIGNFSSGPLLLVQNFSGVMLPNNGSAYVRIVDADPNSVPWPER